MALYLIGNAATPTSSAALASIATGTALKTLLQVKPGATVRAKVIEWGISFDGFAAAAPGKVELIEVNAAATVTAAVAGDLTKLDDAALLGGDPTTALISVGTTSTGFNASGEGSPTTTRYLAGPQFIAPTNQFIQQFPLGREPVIQAGQFGRIRVLFGTGVNAFCYMIVEV